MRLENISIFVEPRYKELQREYAEQLSRNGPVTGYNFRSSNEITLCSMDRLLLINCQRER